MPNALIVPPQSVPPVDPLPTDGVQAPLKLFSKVWWLFFQKLPPAIAATYPISDLHITRSSPPSVAVTGAAWAANVATLTVPAGHRILPGERVAVVGVVPTGYNQTSTITATTATTISYSLPTNPGAYVGGGSVKAIPTYPPASFLPGALFFETDRKILYINQFDAGIFKWVYVSGEWSGVQADLPTDLGPEDAGFIARITDYGHSLEWSGSAWGFAPGDGSEQVVMGPPQGGPPQGGLWGLCDGTAYNCLQAGGTLVSRTTQNLTGDVVIKGAAAPGAQQAATTPTWVAGAKTDDESAHTHTVTVPGGTVQSGLGAGVGLSGTFTSSGGSAHHHNLSNANATMNAPSEAAGGMPKRIAATWWIRR